jgi:hypothetical protein
MTAATLTRLLDDNFRFDVAGRGTVNHLPMALVALSRMGATPERLREYFNWWEANKALPRRDSGSDIRRDEWRRHVGEPPMFDAFSQTFRHWIDDRGADEVVGTVFPILCGGIAAAAFHGLIRLAYGIEADHAGEIAAGLATLCARYVELRLEVDAAPASPSVAAAFGHLAEALAGAAFTGEGIIGRMRAAAADARFVAALTRPPIGEELLAELAGSAIALYWQTGDFTVLHMVTATHAARVLFEYHPQLASREAIGTLWVAACAAYASAGAPPLREAVAPASGPSWDEIFVAAIACNDDHVVKMSYTCHCEAAQYGNPLYQASASRLAAGGKA